MEPALSNYGRASTTPSPVGRMMSAFAADFRDGVDINLGVGYVNEATIPYDLVREGYDAVVGRPTVHRVPLNYGGPEGSANLIRSLKDYLVQRGNGLTKEVLEQHRIIIGPSGATSLLDGLAVVMQPGIVVTADPIYYIYCNELERMGFEVVAVPEGDDGVNVSAVKEVLAELGERRREIRFLYFVTISNPTCTILADGKRQELVRIAEELSEESGRLVPLVLDRAYEDLIHDPTVPTPQSALTENNMGVVHEIGTLSKILAPGLRVGYLIGRDSALMDAMVQRTNDVGFSAPLLTQEIASHLLDQHVQDQLTAVNAGYRRKAQQVAAWLDEYLDNHIEHRTGGQAGFYYYLTLRDVETHERSRFFKYLTRTTGDPATDGAKDLLPRVIVIPGEHCVHPRGQLAAAGRRQFRLSYGFEELERIKQAIAIIAEAAAFGA